MGVGISMTELERLFCHLDGLTATAREERRLMAIQDRGLLDADAIPVFDEATQTAARFLATPICMLSIMTQDQQQIKSAVGLSRAGLMNQLAQSRQLPRTESFCTYVVDSHQVLAIHDPATDPVFARSVLVQDYGIRTYMGVPLLTAEGQCLGTLAVMDFVPRHFSPKDAEFLAMTARWSLSEWERDRLRQPSTSSAPWAIPLPAVSQDETMETDLTTEAQEGLNGTAFLRATNAVKVKLLTKLTQELRTPLTSVMGMASVLGRQVYGPLTSKQKEYLEIIHSSGQHLVSLVDEVVSLGLFEEADAALNLTSVDIEMLCQQVVNGLLAIAQERQQQIRLSVEPGSRNWWLDKDKVRQILHYLVLGIIHLAEAGVRFASIFLAKVTNSTLPFGCLTPGWERVYRRSTGGLPSHPSPSQN